MHRRPLAAFLALLLVGATWTATGTPTGAAPAASQPPILFVHGFMGSGQQFEAQALRFASNGWDPSRIDTFEHDSLAWPDSRDAVWAGIDAKVDALLTASGEDQLVIAGHSQGTGVVQGWLNSSATRAGKVAIYVNLDGGAGGTVPAGVRVLGVWGEGDPAREIPGGTNVQFADQSHTEVVNSPETFAAMYEFITGVAPEFGDVVRDTGTVTVSGRAILFPENVGATDATLRIFRIDPSTGERTSGPIATQELTGDGAVGPFELQAGVRYEFEIHRPAGGFHRIHPQPFDRSTSWFRLLTSEPGGLADSFWEPTATSQNISILRNEEWWGDQGSRSDILEINGANVLTGGVSPRSNRTIGIFLHDAGSDGVSGSVADPPPTGLPFLTGIDLVVPAGAGTTSVRAIPRNGDRPETLCVAAVASIDARTSIQFNSWHRVLDPDGSPWAGPDEPVCADAPHQSAPVAPPAPGGPGATAGPTPAGAVTARPAYTG